MDSRKYWAINISGDVAVAAVVIAAVAGHAWALAAVIAWAWINAAASIATSILARHALQTERPAGFSAYQLTTEMALVSALILLDSPLTAAAYFVGYVATEAAGLLADETANA
ncbi:hypothetical protein [Laribacter hongkongensis]|nr:hypothetical protein [Laribacter hongkongensis]